MGASDPNGSGATDDEIQMEKNAGLIMGTNNSSIVSKRSVERLYLPEPHFYRYFVRKPQRRSPTINRGYWLRMRAVDWAVRQFLEKPSEQLKVVINLGCGYDPLPFQWMAREPDLCHRTKFIDVDYEELMISKRNIISATPKMLEMLNPKEDANPTYEKSILFDTMEYSAIGCDLRNLPRLERLIKSVTEIEQCLILCVAEVSITYMHTNEADALIAWTATLSPDVTFCLLEQGSPDRPDHPFTSTMMKHFNKLGTPLHSVFEYPGIHTQGQRFAQAGFTHCEVQNLWELWADPRFLSPSQRLALDRVEPFDEWEEFALFASHYNLVVAHNRPDPVMIENTRSRRDSIVSTTSNVSARTVSPYRPGAQWFSLDYCEDNSDDTKRHHGSAYQIPGQDAIAIHGGIGPKGRLSSSAVCRPKQLDGETPIIAPNEVGARSCHTVTGLINGQNILVGGRASPTQPKKDCWLQTGSVWSRIHDLPEPRYRHRTVPVTLPDNTYGAVVFGGKTDASRVAVDTLIWGPKIGWQVLRSLRQDPVPRFGASFVYLGYNHGILFGGMRQDGIICQGLWRWRLIVRDNKISGIAFRPSKALDVSIGSYPWFARLGASHGMTRDELLIVGGVAKGGCIPKPYEMLSMLGSFSAFSEEEYEMQLRLTSCDPPLPPDVPRPLLVGHSTHQTKTGMLVFMGGGATCFSFGNYFNSGVLVMSERGSGHQRWQLVQCEAATTSPDETTSPGRAPVSCAEDIPQTASIELSTSGSFLALIQESQPRVISTLNYGPCTSLWTPSYLRSKVSPDRQVVIHRSSTSTMNFQRKDFSYETVSFETCINHLTDPKSHIYLRSLSNTSATTKPANFFEDYPELAPDFHFPSVMSELLSQTVHSSPLRVSNNVTMFLHYDVMANILFQMHGTKKLILFPPSDITKLSFPPGSTTSTLDIFTVTKNTSERGAPDNDDTELSINVPVGTSPRFAILRPGDALYIPALWAHTGISLKHSSTQTQRSTSESLKGTTPSTIPTTASGVDPPVSQSLHTNIALNVFFRSLPSSFYAAGRDIYGNRDISAYEDGRRDLEKIVRRFLSTGAKKTHGQDGQQEETNVFDGIPKDMAKAYLERLADELKKKAAEL